MMKLIKHTTAIWTISDFLEKDICTGLISKVEVSGLADASKAMPDGDKPFGQTNRVLFSNKAFAGVVWAKLKKYAPPFAQDFMPVGVNEQFRLYKYFTGQVFPKHRDASFTINTRERSFYSLLVYCNDDFEGGETSFDDMLIRPQTGTAVIFPHHLEHTGTVVTVGNKYVLRSDIIYRRMR